MAIRKSEVDCSLPYQISNIIPILSLLFVVAIKKQVDTPIDYLLELEWIMLILKQISIKLTVWSHEFGPFHCNRNKRYASISIRFLRIDDSSAWVTFAMVCLTKYLHYLRLFTITELLNITWCNNCSISSNTNINRLMIQ